MVSQLLTFNGQQKGIDAIINDVVNTGKVNGNKDGLRENIQATLIGYGQQGNKTGLENTILSSVNGYTVHIADYTYNNANQLITANYPIVPITYNYTYDANGNMTGDGYKTYQYDSQNRLNQITDKTKTITYTYDDKGYRTSTAVNGNKTYFHYDDGKVAYETDGSGTVTKRYTYDAEGKLVSFTYSGATYYYNFNGHGDIIGLTDANGNQVAGYDYDAYGNIADFTGDIGLAKANPYRYASYRYDDDTDLYYLINRYYDPNAGRFLTKDNVQADPLQPITQNLYVYAGNNPVNFVDPDGHSFKSWLKSKAESFLGVKNDLVNGFNKLTSSVNAKINSALSSVVSGFSRAKTTVLRVASKTVKIIKTGPSKIRAAVRGAKATVLRNFGNARKSFTRVQKKAIAGLAKMFKKNQYVVHKAGEPRKGPVRVASAGISDVMYTHKNSSLRQRPLKMPHYSYYDQNPVTKCHDNQIPDNIVFKSGGGYALGKGIQGQYVYIIDFKHNVSGQFVTVSMVNGWKWGGNFNIGHVYNMENLNQYKGFSVGGTANASIPPIPVGVNGSLQWIGTNSKGQPIYEFSEGINTPNPFPVSSETSYTWRLK